MNPDQLRLAFGDVFGGPPPPAAQLDLFGSATPIEDRPRPAPSSPGERYRHHKRDAGAKQVQLPGAVCERCAGPILQMRRGRRRQFCDDCRK